MKLSKIAFTCLFGLAYASQQQEHQHELIESKAPGEFAQEKEAHFEKRAQTESESEQCCGCSGGCSTCGDSCNDFFGVLGGCVAKPVFNENTRQCFFDSWGEAECVHIQPGMGGTIQTEDFFTAAPNADQAGWGHGDEYNYYAEVDWYLTDDVPADWSTSGQGVQFWYTSRYDEKCSGVMALLQGGCSCCDYSYYYADAFVESCFRDDSPDYHYAYNGYTAIGGAEYYHGMWTYNGGASTYMWADWWQYNDISWDYYWFYGYIIDGSTVLKTQEYFSLSSAGYEDCEIDYEYGDGQWYCWVSDCTEDESCGCSCGCCGCGCGCSGSYEKVAVDNDVVEGLRAKAIPSQFYHGY